MDTDLDKTKDNDAELARWREQALQEDATANALRDQVASLSSLVKELADALDCSVKEHAWIVECGDNVKVCEKCLSEKCVNKKYIDLVKKAREVCK